MRAQPDRVHRRTPRLRSTIVVGAMVAATVAAGPVVSSAGAQGWAGFAVSQLPSNEANGTSPAWGLGITEDLGGPRVDVWNNNHGNMSEAIVDLTASTRSIRSATSYGAPVVPGPDTHGVAFSDIDGDGDEDLLEVSGRNNANRLFRNDNGVLRFVDPGNLADIFGRGRQPIFFDYDNDGDMDVLVTNLDLRSDPVPHGERQLKPSEVYLNNGNGTQWTKVADPNQVITDAHVRIAQLTSTGPATPNIIVTHDVFTLAKDSMAVGVGRMTEPPNPATTRTDTSKPIREVLVGDFDNDLHPEFIVFVGSESTSGGNWPILAHEVSPAGAERTVSLPRSADLDNCRSGAAADFDNDGDLDILAGCTQRQEGQRRNVLLRNDGRGNFTDAGTSVLPATIPETPGAIVTADLDGNGWMDAVVANGYDFDRAPDNVLMNRGGTSAHWLSIDLVGSNADAMGAQVFVGGNSWQVRETGHRYHRSQDGRTLHVGLGSASSIARLEIRWADGTYESCAVSGVDRRVRVVKGSANCRAQTKAGLLAAISTTPVRTTTPVSTVPPTTQPPTPTCAGLPVTVEMGKGQKPTEGDDVILGTPTANLIDAKGGDDVICGLEGDDIIVGGDGKDLIYAGKGNDEIRGGPKADRIRGGPGNDIIRGGDGWDWLYGNAGNDRITGGNGADKIRGGLGVDRIDGGNMRDLCNGGQRVRCEALF